MIAYYVYEPTKKIDTIVMPEMGCAVAVDAERFKAFIAVDPAFEKWSAQACESMAPEDFGEVIALRETGQDVCVRNETLWRERLLHFLPPATGDTSSS